ncbi:ABC transporter permease [Paenibacillus tyrfis]|uniref:ABC transporter permease n=1 Tax=Paenibacillus tyrfis TaxID=1501230 RepID=UPI00209EEC54|nr:ABC transporter permease [Paenibacillus tyrfis]MCP1306052.1 ABC transporter permease [Paenibacillus tyrfis]
MNSLFIAVNLIKRTIGNRRGFLLFIVAPALIVSLIIGFAAKQDEKASVLYINADEGPVGRHILRELEHTGRYRLSAAATPDAMRTAVIEHKADAAFLIPEGFSQGLKEGRAMRVEQLELSMSEASFTLRMSLDQTIRRVSTAMRALDASGQADDRLNLLLEQVEKHQVRATRTDYGWYASPALGLATGILLMFLMGLVNSSVAIMVEDRKQKTMTRMFTAPVRAYEIMLGNFLGSFVVGTLQIVLVLAFTRYAMNFSYGLPFMQHLLVMECFLLAVIGIGSAVAGLIRNSENIGAVNSMVTAPTCMLGGCFWPVSIMPEFMQKLANFVPQTWAIEAIRRLGSGQGLGDVAMHLGVLGLFALVLLGIGSVVMKPGETEAG